MSEINEAIKLPRFDYMSQNNTYSGNVGDFRYKFFPVKKDEIETVFVVATYRTNCYEIEAAASRTEEKEFEYSDEGIDKAQEYLANKLNSFNQ